jgi:ABC-type spermidine/putrescine transport system permease subunit I
MKFSEKIYVWTLILLVILLIALLMVAFVVAGECDKNATKTETVVEHSQQRFQRVIKDDNSALIVYVDTETNVMYLIRSIYGGACVMVDAEGKPLLWDGGATK